MSEQTPPTPPVDQTLLEKIYKKIKKIPQQNPPSEDSNVDTITESKEEPKPSIYLDKYADVLKKQLGDSYLEEFDDIKDPEERIREMETFSRRLEKLKPKKDDPKNMGESNTINPPPPEEPLKAFLDLQEESNYMTRYKQMGSHGERAKNLYK